VNNGIEVEVIWLDQDVLEFLFSCSEMHQNSAVRMLWIKSAQLELTRILCVRWESAQAFRQLGEFVVAQIDFGMTREAAI
jgi:hypothetical protein